MILARAICFYSPAFTLNGQAIWRKWITSACRTAVKKKSRRQPRSECRKVKWKKSVWYGQGLHCQLSPSFNGTALFILEDLFCEVGTRHRPRLIMRLHDGCAEYISCASKINVVSSALLLFQCLMLLLLLLYATEHKATFALSTGAVTNYRIPFGLTGLLRKSKHDMNQLLTHFLPHSRGSSQWWTAATAVQWICSRFPWF